MKRLSLLLLLIAVFQTEMMAQSPTITGFNPASGVIGTSVLITGANFSSTPANNTVYFGATKANVTTASATQLLVIVPYGATYQPITVTVNGLTAYSSKPFIVTFPGGGVMDVNTFLPEVDYTTGTAPLGVAIGDIDGDGKPDLVVVNDDSQTLSVFRNTSTTGSVTAGSFASKVDFTTGPTGTISYFPALGDVDGDGKLDLVVSSLGSNTVSVFRNTSFSGSITASSFAPKVDFPAGAAPYQTAIGDVDGDGKPDLVVTNSDGNSVSVFRNTSSSGSISPNSFASKVDFATASSPYSVAIGDVDGDGKPDLVVTQPLSNSVAVFRNTTVAGSINPSSFGSEVDFTTQARPWSVVIEDMDGDGKGDLVVANNLSNSVSIFRNTSVSGSISTNSFASKADFITGTQPYQSAIGDVDGDGKPDLIVANSGDNTVSVFKNTSAPGSITAGSFATKVDFIMGNTPWYPAIGDIDGDGKPDLVVSVTGGNTISVLRNNIPSIPPYLPFNGLVAWYPFNGNANDESGNANNGTVSGASLTTDRFGKVSSAYSFDGLSNYIAAPSMNLTTYGTISAWVSPVSLIGAIVDHNADVALNSGYTLIYNNSDHGLYAHVGYGGVSGNIILPSPIHPLNLNSWNHCVFVYDNATLKLFLNGVLIHQQSSVNPITQNNELVLFGKSVSGVNIFQGKLDDIAIYNRALSQSEVAQLYSGSIPSVTSFTPTSGPIGASVTVIGSNFDPIAANNIVFFGATKATVTNATSTQLTVTVPAGATYQPFTVTINGLTAYSTKPFIVTFPSNGIIDASSFATKVDFTTAEAESYFVGIGDLDGDGRSDMAVSNYTGSSVSVLRNTSSSGTITASSFATKVDFTPGTRPSGMALGDLNGDGKLDMVVTNYTSSSVSIFQNTSATGSITSGSFGARVDLPTTTRALGAIIGDLDGDGKPDLVVANNDGTTVSVFQNIYTTGAITTASFVAKIDFTIGSNPTNVNIADLDADGKPELVVANGGSNNISILKNTSTVGSISTGSFASAVNLTTGSGPTNRVGVGDLDGDGKPDLTVVLLNGATVSIFRNISTPGIITTGSFAANVDFTTGTRPLGVALGDLDGDGKLELAVACESTNTVSVFKNTSTPGAITTSSFASKIDFPKTQFSYEVVIGDLDGDGKPDLVVGNGNNSVSIFRNQIATLPPTITSFSPLSGLIGATVTITGTNFINTPANNIVYFGATQATVATATATQLTVIVPTGATYQPITVIVDGLTAYSSAPFIVTFPGGGVINANTFLPKVDFTTGVDPYGVAIVDVDGDGEPDLVLTTYSSNAVSVFRNTSASGSPAATSFASNVDFTTGTQPLELAIGDVDGDGKPDLVVSNSVSHTVSIFRNTSASGSITAGSFASKVDFMTGNSPGGAAIGDVDGDGKPELVIANLNSYTVSVFRNTSSSGSITVSSFASKVDFATGSSPYGVAIGDVDKDGKPDLVVTNVGSTSVSVFRNTSVFGSITASSFASKVDFATGSGPYGVAIGDVDKDGKPDLVVTNVASTSVSVFRNTSVSGSITVGSFAGKVDFTTGTSPYYPAIGDVDGDGKPDLVVSNYDGNTVSVLKNTSAPGSITANSFAPKVDFTTGSNPYGVTIGDVDGDGKPDLVVTNTVSNTLSVFHNAVGTSTPTITSFNPPSGTAGASVTISGTNFDTTPANNTVKFNGTAATITGTPATTSITATVPAGATTGAITVTVGGLTGTSSTSFVVAPAITSFNPVSGIVGTSVIITGSNFSTTLANNTIKFNGTTAVLTGTSTTTSITATVPSDATNGPITVTVGGLTGTSSTNFTVTLPPLQITEAFVKTFNKGSTLTESISVSDVSRVTSVTIKYRGISEPSSALKSATLTGAGSKFEKIFTPSELSDPIGLIFYFEVLDNTAVTLTSTTTRALIKYPEGSSEENIPDLDFGGEVRNYHIIAIPFDLTDKSVTKVFSALGGYDKKNWRLFEFDNGDNREYPGFTSISSGRGYWLIARNSTTINPGEGTTPQVDDTAPFIISLSAGWNLIGNPYNFRVSWTDVLAANTATAGIGGVGTQLKIFSGGTLADGTILEKFRGAFVFSNNAADVKIPVTRNTSLGGRINVVKDFAIDEPRWEVKLLLGNGTLSNELGGIGMDPGATLSGKDAFDEVSVPLPDGLGLFELAFPHKELHTDFNKEVVPTRENFRWDFNVKRGFEIGNLELSWKNDYFGKNDKQLIMFDPATLQVMDMRKVDHISLTPASTKLTVLYGGKEYVEAELDDVLPWLGYPYPNPARDVLSIPFRVPESYDQLPVKITVLNATGVEVATPVDKTLGKGNYEVKWYPQGEPGLYLIRMRIGLDETKAIKVIVK